MSDTEYVYVRYSDLPPDPNAPPPSSDKSNSSSASSGPISSVVNALASLPFMLLSQITPRYIQDNKTFFVLGGAAISGIAVLTWAITDTNSDIFGLDVEEPKPVPEGGDASKMPVMRPTGEWQEV